MSAEAVTPAAETATPATEPGDTAAGLYLYGVVRARGWAQRRRRDDGILRVRYRELEALVRPAPFERARADSRAVQEHQRTVDRVMRRATILPAPFGVVFRGRRAVIRFLEDQYIVLDEGLGFLDGHWELRLHILSDNGADAAGLAEPVYSELRRQSRAALPLPTAAGVVMSAAFLVERGSWLAFVERAEELNRARPGLVFDLTGPWPPYDFVRVKP